jgi:hypothetical protein
VIGRIFFLKWSYFFNIDLLGKKRPSPKPALEPRRLPTTPNRPGPSHSPRAAADFDLGPRPLRLAAPTCTPPRLAAISAPRDLASINLGFLSLSPLAPYLSSPSNRSLPWSHRDLGRERAKRMTTTPRRRRGGKWWGPPCSCVLPY